MIQNNKLWEESFDEKFCDNQVWLEELMHELERGDESWKQIKSFIHSTLNKEREELIKTIFHRIEEELSTKAKKPGGVPTAFADGMTTAQTIILTILKENGKN